VVDGITVTADTIYLGLLADLSGPLSGHDVDLVDAQLVFWSDLNESGGIAGRRVELLIEDTGLDPDRYRASYADLKDRVVFFSHSTGSQNTAAIATDLVVDDRLAVATGWYSGWADPGLGANVIETGSNYCIEAINGLSALAAAHQLETGFLPTLAIATDGSEYGEDSAAGARILAEELGLQIRLDGGGSIDPTRDMSAVGSEIAGVEADLTWLATEPNSTAEIVTAALAEDYAGSWSGAMPSFSPRLLATDLGDYLAENWTLSMLFSPAGADVVGMSEVYAGLADAFPDRYPSDSLIKGYIEFAATKQILDHAAELGDLTPEGLLTARADLDGLEFGGISPPTVFADNLNDAVTRETALYLPNKEAFDEQGGLSASFAAGAVAPYDLIQPFEVSDVAATYSFDVPCYTIAIPLDEG
jgi:ABC-type branched-subunit amino acid transport system substrate-binding protein